MYLAERLGRALQVTGSAFIHHYRCGASSNKKQNPHAQPKENAPVRQPLLYEITVSLDVTQGYTVG